MRDMTKGSAMEHLWKYALPLLLGNWFQMGYHVVDSIIVGRLIGRDALAAVGIASPVMNLVILGISGLCLGAGVLMSEYFGAKDWKKLRIQFSTTLLSGAVLSGLIALAGILFQSEGSYDLFAGSVHGNGRNCVWMCDWMERDAYR